MTTKRYAFRKRISKCLIVSLSASLFLLIPISGFTQEQTDQVNKLIEQLKSPNYKVRLDAASALGEMGSEAQDAVPALSETLRDSIPEVRAKAAYVLGQMGVGSRGAVPALSKALKDQVADVRSEAASALGEMGAEARGAVPALSEALKDPIRDVRNNAAHALAKIGAAIEAMPALIKALKDRVSYVRANAAYALGEIGAAAKDAVPALIEALKDNDDGVKGDYWAPPLIDHHGQDVQIRFNPDDNRSLLVYSADTGKFICEAALMGQPDSPYKVEEVQRAGKQFRAGLLARMSDYVKKAEEFDRPRKQAEQRKKARRAAQKQAAKQGKSDDSKQPDNLTAAKEMLTKLERRLRS